MILNVMQTLSKFNYLSQTLVLESLGYGFHLKWPRLFIVAGQSCKDILEKMQLDGQIPHDGVYTIEPKEGLTIPAYCDMTRDGGGWTLMVRQNLILHFSMISLLRSCTSSISMFPCFISVLNVISAHIWGSKNIQGLEYLSEYPLEQPKSNWVGNFYNAKKYWAGVQISSKDVQTSIWMSIIASFLNL